MCVNIQDLDTAVPSVQRDGPETAAALSQMLMDIEGRMSLSPGEWVDMVLT